MQPRIPPLNSLRLATPSDIPRIGIIAVSGFYYSPVFHWYRPYHSSYPASTLNSYRKIFGDYIKSPKHIVLVAVDKFVIDESEKSGAVIPEGEKTVKDEGEEVIVGVAVWNLEEGSKRVGQFQGDWGDFPSLPIDDNKDKDAAQDKILCEKAEAAQHKYFSSSSELDMLVVHPAYWKRGHGSTLVKWGLEISKIDGVAMGVIGPDMGVNLYKSLGFKPLIDLVYEGNDLMPEGLKMGVLKFEV